MCLTGKRSRPSSETVEPAPVAVGDLLRWRAPAALLFCLLPWPAVWLGLYHFGSAPLAFAFYHAVCFAGGFLLRSPGLPDPEQVYTVRHHYLLLVVLAANLIAWLLYDRVGAALLDRPAILGLMEKRGLGPSTYAWLFPYFAFVNPLAEEFFWRGGVYATFRRRFASPVAATVIQSAFFGAWHWTVFRLFLHPAVAVAGTAGVILVGVALTVFYERTRKLPYTVALHALAGDTPLLLLLLLLGRA